MVVDEDAENVLAVVVVVAQSAVVVVVVHQAHARHRQKIGQNHHEHEWHS